MVIVPVLHFPRVWLNAISIEDGESVLKRPTMFDPVYNEPDAAAIRRRILRGEDTYDIAIAIYGTPGREFRIWNILARNDNGH